MKHMDSSCAICFESLNARNALPESNKRGLKKKKR